MLVPVVCVFCKYFLILDHLYHFWLIIGSRLHIFSWKPRIFDTVPPPLTIPKSDEKTTERISPGISDFVDDYPGLKLYFEKLIDECKNTLIEYESNWHNYPIYLRATGKW